MQFLSDTVLRQQWWAVLRYCKRYFFSTVISTLFFQKSTVLGTVPTFLALLSRYSVLEDVQKS